MNTPTPEALVAKWEADGVRLNGGADKPYTSDENSIRALTLAGCAYELKAALAASKAEQHPDDAAVDRFAAAMKEKLAAARAKGRGGWDGDEPGMQQRLSDMLAQHVEKGDPRDVANFAMFLFARGEAILPASKAEPCRCHQCTPITLDNMRMILCPNCGNKRCPHANDHRNACTGSNEPGQPGSAYPKAEAAGGEAVAMLRSVLCDPSGEVCIAGSDGDREVIRAALAALSAPAVAVEAVAWPLHIEASTWEAASFIFGSREDGFCDAELFIGEHTDDDGKVGYGLLIRSADYPEEGVVPMAELDRPANPAAGAVPECPHRTRCDCLAACKYGHATQGAAPSPDQEK